MAQVISTAPRECDKCVCGRALIQTKFEFAIHDLSVRAPSRKHARRLADDAAGTELGVEACAKSKRQSRTRFPPPPLAQ